MDFSEIGRFSTNKKYPQNKKKEDYFEIHINKHFWGSLKLQILSSDWSKFKIELSDGWTAEFGWA